MRHLSLCALALTLAHALAACGDSGGGGGGSDADVAGDATGDAPGEPDADADATEPDADAGEPDADVAETDADVAETDADVAEPDADIAEPDADAADTDGDAAETDGDAVEPPSPYADFCLGPCTQAEEDGDKPSCDDLLGWLGTDEEGCVAACAAKLELDLAFASNLTCFDETCDAEVCGGEPFPVHALCPKACAGIVACDLESTIDLPEDDVPFCEAACSGVIASQPPFEALIACMGDTLAEGCVDDVIEACMAEGFSCAQSCELGLLGSGEPGDEPCPEEAPIWSSFPTLEACQASCEAQGEGNAVAFLACLKVSGCQDATPCLSLPAGDDPNCVGACAAGEELCGEGFLNLPVPGWCPGFCTGVFTYFGIETSPGAAECIAAEETCPAPDPENPDDNPAFGLLFACTGTMSESCETICGALSACNPEEGENCPAGCAQAELGSPDVVESILACVEAAGGDCEKLGPCFGGGGGSSVCQSLCDNAGPCGGAPEGCAGECEEAISSGSLSLPSAACQGAALDCANDAVCDGLTGGDVLAECTAACQGQGTCGQYGPEGCAQVCSGVLVGLSLTGADAATCVRASLDESGCYPGAAKGCLGP